MGTEYKTATGVSCVPWSARLNTINNLHVPPISPFDSFSNGDWADQKNYCRAVNGNKPWCYTESGWGLCDIATCGKEGTSDPRKGGTTTTTTTTTGTTTTTTTLSTFSSTSGGFGSVTHIWYISNLVNHTILSQKWEMVERKLEKEIWSVFHQLQMKLSGNNIVSEPSKRKFIVFEFVCFLLVDSDHHQLKWSGELSVIAEISEKLFNAGLVASDFCDSFEDF